MTRLNWTSRTLFAVAAALLCLTAKPAAGAETSAAPAEPLVLRSAQSGAWSAGATWEGGKMPDAGARVLIRPGHRVVYDVASDALIRAINVGGTLTFARDRDTRLNVGLLKIQAADEYSEEGFDCDAHVEDTTPDAERAALEVGTKNEPIPAGHTAVIRLHEVAGLDGQSCPAIVNCGGRMDFHGAAMNRTWVKLGATAAKGTTAVKLAEAVTGWRAGDLVIITATHGERDTGGTRRKSKRDEDVFTEERRIKSVDGAELTLDRPLDFAHRGEGELRGEVANLSRNVVVESAAPDGVRGHTMYHRGSAGSVSYAEFRHLGKEGVLGRYSLHFHLVGVTMRGSSVVGASIWDSHNRWLTIHGTNYLVVRDCVGYQSVGHGFFLEDGTEVFNVLDRNLAVQAYHGARLPKQVLPFDQNEGAGFWWANSLNTFTRNVTCENDRYGYRFEATPSSQFDIKSLEVTRADGTIAKTDVRMLPFVRFDDNEAHCDGKYGVNLGEGVARVGPDERHPFIMRRTKIWEIHYAFRPQSPCLLVDGLHIENCDYGVYHPNYDRHAYRNVKILSTDTEPFNRGHDDDSVQYGPLSVDGLVFSSRYYGGDMPFIQISDDNPTGKGVSHFRNLQVLDRPAKSRKPLIDLGGGPQPTPKTAHSVAYYIHDYYGPGKHAKVASVKAKDLLADGNQYRSEPPLTGEHSRVTEVTGIEFPTLLDPRDDLPPATVITNIRPAGSGKLFVEGTVSDNGDIKRVTVAGQAATLTRDGGRWQVEIAVAADAPRQISAVAEDAAGNVEPRAHVVSIPASVAGK